MTHHGGARIVTRDELMTWGEALGRELRPPAVLTLEGDLGAGKTTLAQAIARGLGVSGPVTSPTFALVHEYAASGGFPVYHLDLYRLRGPDELDNLAFDEIVYGSGVTLVEWPERGAGRLPTNRHRIRLSHVAEDDTLRMVEQLP